MFKSVDDFCIKLKERIFKVVNLSCSIGCASNKFIAKIASELDKPNGLSVVDDNDIEDKVWVLDIKKMWGVGEKTAGVLRAGGLNTIGDIARMSVEKLKDFFGSNAYDIWCLANGQDCREVCPVGEAKSIGNEITFKNDTLDREYVESVLMGLCEKVSARLRAGKVRGRTVNLKIRLKNFSTFSSLKIATSPYTNGSLMSVASFTIPTILLF